MLTPPLPGGVAIAAIVSFECPSFISVAFSCRLYFEGVRTPQVFFCSASTSLLIRHCCAIDSNVFVSQ